MASPCRRPNWRNRLSKAAKCTHDESARWMHPQIQGCQNSGKMVDSRPSPKHISSQVSLVEYIASKFYKYSTIRSTVVKSWNLLFPVEQWRSIWVTLCDVVTSDDSDNGDVTMWGRTRLSSLVMRQVIHLSTTDGFSKVSLFFSESN